MLPILGKPMVERVMDSIIANGIDEFILVVNPEDGEIIQYFEKESHLNAKFSFVYQTEQKGMAHALSLAAPLISDNFLLSACDNLVASEDINLLLRAWKFNPKYDAVLALMRMPRDQIVYSAMVLLDGTRVLGIREKPAPGEIVSETASLPLYLFSQKILEYLPEVQPSPRGEYDLQDAIQIMISQGNEIGGQFVNGRSTITTAEDLLAVNLNYLMKEDEIFQLSPRSLGTNTNLVKPVYIDTGTTIGSECLIGPNVYIEKDCLIGDKVHIRNAVVLRGTNIPDGSAIENSIVNDQSLPTS
jgi:glucose-1-phosphate thymidylyltransferase